MFSSEKAFDKHRVGPFGQTPPARRCLTPTELKGRLQYNPLKDQWSQPFTMPIPTAGV
jgi:hypothetical protein